MESKTWKMKRKQKTVIRMDYRAKMADLANDNRESTCDANLKPSIGKSPK